MIYLEKVQVFLENWEDRSRFEELAKIVESDGIKCNIKRWTVGEAGERWTEEGACAEASGAGCKEAGFRAEAFETGGGEEGFHAEPEAVLYITDSTDAVAKLTETGRPVLVFLHEKNRGEDFSVCQYVFESPEELDAVYLDRVFRRFYRLPWEILETERCLIRETMEEDVEDFYRIYAEESMTKYMDKLYEDPEEEKAYARDYIDQVYSFYQFGIWTVTDKASHEVIGRAGISYREGYTDPEIGFLIAGARQGQGLATEVCRAILDYARKELGFKKVLAFVRKRNKVSLHVCEKIGMEVVETVKIQRKQYVMLQIVFEE